MSFYFSKICSDLYHDDDEIDDDVDDDDDKDFDFREQSSYKTSFPC